MPYQFIVMWCGSTCEMLYEFLRHVPFQRTNEEFFFVWLTWEYVETRVHHFLADFPLPGAL